MAKTPRTPAPEQQAEVSLLAAQFSSFDPARIGTGTSKVDLTNNNLTATADAAATVIGTAATTPGDNTTVYLEVRASNWTGVSGPVFGLINSNYVLNGNIPTGSPNACGFDLGGFYINNANVAGSSAVTFVAGDWIGIAVNFPNKTIQFRNITQNLAWSAPASFASITPTPVYFAVGFRGASQTATVNFDGTFLGSPPSGGFARWHTAPTSPMTGPKDTFSEQPATVITVDALIANGSYTSSNPGDQVALPFSIVQFGAATLDTNSNLQFQDVIIDDPPLLAITLQVAGPATVSIFGAWDYGAKFPITTVVIPTSTAVSISNVPILPPNYPQFGQGDILQLFLACSTTALFTWSNGHVYGVETVPIFPTVETAPIPPSRMGELLVKTGGTSLSTFPTYTPLFPPPLVGQGGGAAPTFPPPTPPPIGAIPAGILVGPAIAAAAVPPSVAGIPRLVFTFGSATAPPASAAFPEFTTTFPSPPIVFSNIFTDGVSPTTPPSTASTQCIALGSVYGPPIGPALPAVVPPRTFMAMASSEGDDESELVAQSEDESEPEQEDDDNPGHEDEEEAESNPSSELKQRYSLPPRRTKAKPHRGHKPKK